MQKISKHLLDDPQRLFDYLRGLEGEVSTLRRTVEALGKQAASAASSPTPSIDVAGIRDQLELQGDFPINVTGLPGKLSEAQKAQLLILPADPTVAANHIDASKYEVGQFGTFGGTIYYVADGNPHTWAALPLSVAAHSLLSATHTDTTAAAPVRGDIITADATPKWLRKAIGTAFQLLRVNVAGTDLEYGVVDDTMLSANVALHNLINPFTVEQQFRALTALTIGGGANVNGAMHRVVLQAEEVDLAGVATKDSSANLLAGNSLILPVLAIITQTISGGGVTKFSAGDATTAGRFILNNTNLGATTGFWMYQHLSGAVATEAAGPTQTGAAKLRTTLDFAPTQGKIRYVTCCLAGTPPTS